MTRVDLAGERAAARTRRPLLTRVPLALLGLLVIAALGSGIGAAHAERVRTTGPTKVFKGTGERSGVITKIASGKTLSVLNTQGRWLKVRVNGRTGWVTRSSVVSLAETDVPRNTRRRPFVDGRSTRRGWADGAPDDRVGADAVDPGGDDGEADGGGDGDGGGDDGDGGGDGDGGDDGDGSDDDDGDDGGAEEAAPEMAFVVVTADKAKLYPRASRKAKASRTLRRGARLTVLEDQGDWIRVEFGDDAGYVSADLVGVEGSVRKKREITAIARLGFASIGGTFTSNGPAMQPTGPPSNYSVSSTALSVDVGVELVYAYKKDYFLGGGIEYLGCVATPGIRYADAMNAEDIGFKTHDIDLRVLGGYDFHDKRGMTAWGRLGYHVGLVSFSNLMNLAQLPSETFKGPSIGVGLKVPKVTDKIGASGSLDLVYPGSRSQTQNNEDGAEQGAMAATLQLIGDYAWKDAWALQAAYRLGYAKTAWSGASNRVTNVTAAERRDLSHVLTLGLGRSF
jgi:uncharacterized protein YgiM (DUF1202 family)